MAVIDDLIAYFKLDEASGNALDAHGSNNLTDSGSVGSATGKISNARDFESGSNQYFSIADNADFSTGDIDFSLAAWVNIESKSNYRMVAGKSPEYQLYYDPVDGDRFVFYVTGGSFATVVINTAPTTGTWYYVACGHSAALNELWISVNAGTPNTTSHSDGVNDGGASFGIGRRPEDGLYFDGLIDEVGFWKRDIRSDLTTLYGGGVGLAYPFGGGGGGNILRQMMAHAA